MEIILPGKPRRIENAPQELTFVLLGGIKPTAEALAVHEQTIRDAMWQGYFRSRALALKASELSAEHGTKIPAAELAGLEEWSGPTRHPELVGGSRKRNGGKGGRVRRTGGLYPISAAPAAKLRARLVGNLAASR